MNRSLWQLVPEVTLLLLMVVVGCEAPGQTAFVAQDSAGIELKISDDSGLVFGTVEADPELTLGGPDAEGATQFAQIQGILIDPSGRIWVADGQSGEVRIFNEDGSHWRTVGGRGQGPGEFLQIQLLGLWDQDRVILWDRGNARRTLLALDGSLVESNRLPTGESAVPRAYGVFQDGTLLAPLPTVLQAGSLSPGITFQDTLRLMKLEVEDGHQKQVAVATGPTWLWTGRQQLPIPFTINPAVSVEGESVLLADGPAFRIQRFWDGETVEIYGVDRAPRAVSEEDLEAYRRFTTAYVQEERREEYLRLLDHPERPESLPGYSQLVIDDSGRTWALIYSADLAESTWDVYDSERIWMGQVHGPSGFQVMEIKGNQLYGVWRDELGAEYVRAYRFQKSG